MLRVEDQDLPASIRQLPDRSMKLKIIATFWGPTDEHWLYRYENYFRGHFHDECQKFQWQALKQQWTAESAAITHTTIIAVAQTLAKLKSSTKSHLRGIVREEVLPNGDAVSINQSIEFVARLWLMLNVRTAPRTLTPGTPFIRWPDDCSLSELIAQQFPGAMETFGDLAGSEKMDLRLEVTLTAPNLIKWSGVRLEWTACLADHLRHDREHRVVRVFPYRECIMGMLTTQRKAEAENSDSSFLYPSNLLHEMLATLDLLFPPWSPAVTSFLSSEKKEFLLRGSFGAVSHRRPLRLREFDYWKERLLEINDLFHEPAPGWSQLWADKRNPQQFYTFWIALLVLALTIVFGLITSIAGIIQCYATVEALNVARKQYRRDQSTQ